MLHDVADNGVRLVTVDGPDRVFGIERPKFLGHGLVDEVLRRLDEEHLVVFPGEPVGVASEGTSFARPRQGVKVINNHL